MSSSAPAARGRRIDGETELSIRKLLLGPGPDDSLGYFATRRDKTVLISPDGRAAISYRVIASVALASADPLGPKDAWPGAIHAWLNEARTYGWVPAALSPGRDAAQAYVDAGLRAIPLGDEAIIDVNAFTLAGPAMKAVRQAVVRVQRAGYTVSIRRHRDIDPAELSTLAACAEAWRGDAPERGFSMALSRLGDPADGSCLMVVAHHPDGTPAGLLSFVPWGQRGVSLDLMRREHDGINGLVELMVTTLIERKSDFGLKRISLNFAMFRAVFAEAEEFGAGPVTKLNNAVLGRVLAVLPAGESVPLECQVPAELGAPLPLHRLAALAAPGVDRRRHRGGLSAAIGAPGTADRTPGPAVAGRSSRRGRGTGGHLASRRVAPPPGAGTHPAGPNGRTRGRRNAGLPGLGSSLRHAARGDRPS